jgi:endonuclease/exonuclease/phosphatase family metal-dependent hydrolase
MKFFWWPKRWWVRLPLLVVGIVVLPYVFSRVASHWRCIQVQALPQSSPLPAGVPRDLRIVTYNIAHGRGLADNNWQGGSPAERTERLDRIASFLRAQHADVVVLNEVDFDSSWSDHVNQAEYLAKQAGYPHWAEARNLDFRFLVWTWRFGNAILSKYPIVDAREVSLPGEVGWETILAGKKRAVICELDAAGNRFRVLGAHLSHRSEPVRVASAKMIAALAADSPSPLVVAGDLNSTPPGFPHSSHDADGENAIAILDRSGRFKRSPLAAPDEEGMTYPSVQGIAVIDWILIPAS